MWNLKRKSQIQRTDWWSPEGGWAGWLKWVKGAKWYSHGV